MTEAEDQATADMHPCIATDTDPTPVAPVRPLFAKYAPCPASRGGAL